MSQKRVREDGPTANESEKKEEMEPVRIELTH